MRPKANSTSSTSRCAAAQAWRCASGSMLAGCSMLLWLGAQGCAVTETIAAPRDEYSAYREVRTARRVEDRLKASDAYLEKYPQGLWMREVRPWFDRAEAKYYAKREESAPGLAEYLEVLPHGPHADAARRELFRHRARVAEGQSAQLVADARYTEKRLAELARERDTARDTLSAWIARLLSINSWGERTSSLDGEFIFAWRIDKPAARCVEDRCSKLVELPFELPGGGEEVRRELDFEVVLKLREGRVWQASLQGPGAFSRLYEAARSKAVAPDDGAARVLAIAFAAQFIGGAAESKLPAARCGAEDAGRLVLKRACDGWSLEVVVADSPAEDDVVTISGPPR